MRTVRCSVAAARRVTTFLSRAYAQCKRSCGVWAVGTCAGQWRWRTIGDARGRDATRRATSFATRRQRDAGYERTRVGAPLTAIKFRAWQTPRAQRGALPQTPSRWQLSGRLRRELEVEQSSRARCGMNSLRRTNGKMGVWRFGAPNQMGTVGMQDKDLSERTDVRQCAGTLLGLAFSSRGPLNPTGKLERHLSSGALDDTICRQGRP